MEKNILWTIMVIVGTIKSILFFIETAENTLKESIFFSRL